MKSLLRALVPPIVVFILFVWAAQLIVVHLKLPGYLVPTPKEVLHAAQTHHAELLEALWATAKAALMGFGASVVIGILLAVMLSTSRLIQRAFYPYTIFFQTVPVIAIAPMLVIWVGAGIKSVATCALIVSVFPVIANTLTGLRSSDPMLRDLFKLYGASKVATLWKLKLPAALPSIITGLRIAAGLSVIGTVVGEFVAGELDENRGLGIYIQQSTNIGNTDQVFAAVLAASLLGLGMLCMINLVGYLTLRRWHASEQN